jgi:hypothetical protein
VKRDGRLARSDERSRPWHRVIAGNHYAATQSMDEEHRQEVSFLGAFGSEGPIIRSVRKADEGVVSMSALLLKPGQDAGMDDETFLLGLNEFSIACRRGSSGQPSDWHTYKAVPGTPFASTRRCRTSR